MTDKKQESQKRLRIDTESDVAMGPPDVEWMTDEEEGVLCIEVKDTGRVLRSKEKIPSKDFDPAEVVAAAGGQGPKAEWHFLCNPEDEDEEDSDYVPSSEDEDDEDYETSEEDDDSNDDPDKED